MLTTKTIVTLFVALAAYYYPELLENPKETPLANVEENYDFIIIGAGSAGSVLANRLSEISQWKILLVESGGDETVRSKTPLFQKVFWNLSQFWPYSTVKQQHACLEFNGICNYPSGRIMGGSSSLNGMLYARGSRHDFDEWEAMGCPQWSYDNILPYFKKSESTQISELRNSSFHGTEGPLIVQHAKYRSLVAPSMIEAAQEVGIPHRDYNGEYLTGVDIPQVTINGAQRWSASSAYLLPASSRSNLHIVKNAFVKKILIHNDTAIGIEFEQNGSVRKVKAIKEVLLSAGAINSPKLLMLSGIGPKNDLERLGIGVVADLPVGKNLHDHAQVRLTFKLKGNVSISRDKYGRIEELLAYVRDKNGLYTYNGFALMIFFSSGDKIAMDPPDIQIHVNDYHHESFDRSIITVIVNKAKPESRGTVTLKNSNPAEPPIIDPKYFTSNIDVEDTIKGLHTAIKIMKSTKMAQYEPEIAPEFHPQCQIKELDEFLRCVIKHNSGTIYHPVGTVMMGSPNDSNSVVDSELKVKSIKNLRVIDASIMPKIVRANTNAATIMIAEKASDIIKINYNKITK